MKRNVQNSKNKPPNTNKGITLVALVITIIVLLILAGVAITMAINSDGLFGKANEAAEKWNTAVKDESIAITNLLDIAENIGLPEGWEGKKIANTVTETSTITGAYKTRIVPIPKGFTVSQIGGTKPENTIAGGLVIYQIPEGAIVDWTNNKITLAGETTEKTLQETANQFVWIPVDDINQMVMCKGNNKNGTVSTTNTEEVCKLELEKNAEGDYALRCKTHNPGGDNTTVLCGRLYGTDIDTSTTIKKTNINFSDRTQTWPTDTSSDTSYREPDILDSSYDSDTNTGGLTAFTVQMKNDFINMAISVAKYGGFYVSRYESGVNGSSLKNQIVITAGTAQENPTVYQGVNMWYGLYTAVKNSTVVDKTVLNAHMIYGSQYDQIINFLESNSSNEPQIGHADRQSNTQGLTGSNRNDIMNNIYDLEGNYYEWTAQARFKHNRVLRGGCYSNAYPGGFFPASRRVNLDTTTTDSRCATRLSLYL